MGTFKVKCKVENIINRQKAAVIPKMLVDTGSEYTWVLAKTLEELGIEREKKDLMFVMVNGQKITRSVGFAIIRYDKCQFAATHNRKLHLQDLAVRIVVNF